MVLIFKDISDDNVEKTKSRKKWTEEETMYLDEKWGKVSFDTIRKKLKRSEASILNKVQKMRLGAFLNNDEYVTYNILMKELGFKKQNSYQNKSWIENRKLPIKYKRVNKNKFKIIYLDDFWKWAEKNKQFIDWTKVKKNALGDDPQWVKELRKNQLSKFKTTIWTKEEDLLLKKLLETHRYNYLELAEKMNRSHGAIQRRILDLSIKARPVKVDNHIKYTEEEKENIEKFILSNDTYVQISAKIKKSEKAIRGFVFRKYGSENLDKVRNKIIENSRTV